MERMVLKPLKNSAQGMILLVIHILFSVDGIDTTGDIYSHAVRRR